MSEIQETQRSAPLNESSNQTTSETTSVPEQTQSTQPETQTSKQSTLQTTTPPLESTPQPKPESKLRKRILIALIIIVTISAVTLFAYWILNKKQTVQNQPNTNQGQSTIEQESSNTNNIDIVDANNQFALDYYSELKDKNDGNIFYSPFSISTALAMTYEGAKGQTAKEMQSVFYFPEDSDLRRSDYANIYAEINKEDKKYELKTANALWAQEDYQFLKDYLDIIEKYYDGNATNLDFKKDPEGSRVTINNWVENQTNNKIKNLLPPKVINELTRLVLTNAIYFKGEWQQQFNKESTTDHYFTTNNNETVEVEMMQRTDEEAKFNYTENDLVQMLEMPYSGEELSMLILLPKDDGLSTLENSLNTSKLSEWKQNLKNQRVKVYIPKFKFDTKYMMADDLKAMGMPTAFSQEANFSGMDGKQNLYIGNVIHQAFIEVNEEGTEAAAATAVVMKDGASNQNAPIIPVFQADHPFIFIIQENAAGNILFIGRVTNPTQNI